MFGFPWRADPTRHWVAQPHLPLQFDFDVFELCGVGLGDRVEALCFLGPAEDSRWARRGRLRYFSRGVEIDVADELICGYVLHWSWPNEYGAAFDAFAGSCTHRGQPCRLHRETNFLDFIAEFDEPDDRLQAGTGWLFLYEYAGARMQAEFDELDLLCTAAISAPR